MKKSSDTAAHPPPPSNNNNNTTSHSNHSYGHNTQASPNHNDHSNNNTDSTSFVNNQDTLLNGIGPYTFLKQLGNGKFSRVMLATHSETQTQVAIKIINKQAHDYRVMSRLVREINLMEVLDHPNIVKLFETYETCDSLFLVMEYVPGHNLDEYLQKSGGTLTEKEARNLFRQLVAAVSFCHSRWVVHRDLKTPNILITPDGVVKLADFGLGNRFGLQRLRTICGSMLYYSPEIISGQKYYGPEVDCWCLGVALFRMTAGFEPFSHAHTVGELKKDVCSCNFPMPSNLSIDLQRTIRKCLQVDRRRRMSVRAALQDDAWLTDNHLLPCPITDNEAVHANGRPTDYARRQYIRDLENSQHSYPAVKRTVIYHPVNASTYFTTKTSSNEHYHYQHQRIEMLRSEILQSIRQRARRLGMRSTKLITIMPSFKLDKGKRSLKLSEMLQRYYKDQMYWFQLTRPEGSRPPSLSSGSSSTSSMSTVGASDNEDIPNPAMAVCNGDRVAQDVMTLVKETCQLMGITFVQESPTQLICVLTLRDAQKSDASLSPPPPVRRRESRNSSRSTTGSVATTTNGAFSMEEDGSRAQTKRMSLPLLSHLTSSMTTSFFGRTKQRHSIDGRSSSISESLRRNKKKDGVAVFTIDIKQTHRKSQLVGLRFSKQQGSSSVFKMAGGWITGVISMNDFR
ncbi:kinase-like domain-containing protein [Radiomyces spectabilis]|uniref:kinase-like domain-containing protein n=1 Tax=Radiomyces spectabilis TaxID=64574 RepID=UPI00221F413D|nr:kinase-like domain-containing protein [Radiomyces spectabilis]KAI8377425.1 kinase-like domain-containing protein [Radiomyces spectabilis]